MTDITSLLLSNDVTYIRCLDYQEDDEDELIEYLVDMTIHPDDRHAILKFYKQKYPNNFSGIISKFIGLYTFFSNQEVLKFLYEILVTNIPTSDKVLIVESIGRSFVDEDSDKESDDGYGSDFENEFLDVVPENHSDDNLKKYLSLANDMCIELDSSDVSTPVKISVLLTVLETDNKEEYFSSLLGCIKCILDKTDTLECDYRYKIILSIKSKFSNKKNIVKDLALHFINNKANMSRYRILSAQLLLQDHTLTDTQRVVIEESVLSFATDTDLDYDLRADAADLIMSFGTDKNKEVAGDVIILLGREGVLQVRSVYQNAQNVHTGKIMDSAVETIQELFIKYSNPIGSPDSILDWVSENGSLHKVFTEDDIKKLTIAVNRIVIDRGLYTPIKISLLRIFKLVFTFITEEKNHELNKRFVEELIEASSKCSSGYVTRMTNALSGFSNFNTSITWEEQIAGNVMGRLNARIRKLPEEDAGDILVQMAIPSDSVLDRAEFLKFFTDNIGEIVNELIEEFSPHLPMGEIDLYLRNAILSYTDGVV
jgi:hypothetical protein